MELLVKGRSVIRTGFTRNYNKIVKDLKDEPVNIEAVKVTYRQLEKAMNELMVKDEAIFNLMLGENKPEEDMVEDRERAEEYQGKFFSIQLSYNEMTANSQSSVNNVVNSVNNKSNYKLPKINWNQFSGKLIDWLGFWSQFKKVHDNKDLDDEDKFQYLIQATLPGCKPREIVESYPATGANYEKAIASLKSRFGREEILVEVYVRELLKLVLSNALNPTSVVLTSLYDRLETYLRALESLGVTSDKCSSMLYPLVESCLPMECLKEWQRSSYFKSENEFEDNISVDSKSTLGEEAKSRLNQLMKFLRREVEGEQRVKLALEGFGIKVEDVNQSASKEKNIPPKDKPAKQISTASSLVTNSCPKYSKTDVNRCCFCEQLSHASYNCYKAKKLSLREKRDKLRLGGFCFRCLKQGCLAFKCRARLSCKECGRRHVELMCPGTDESAKVGMIENSSVINRKKDAATATTAFAKLNVSTEVLLQTINVILRGPAGKKVVRVIIDSGSQYSYILDSLARELGFEVIGNRFLQHALFGGYTSELQSHDCFKIELYSVDSVHSNNLDVKEVSLELVVLGQSKICDYVPKVGFGEWQNELESLNIKLTHNLEDTRPIELLLGADIIGRLFTGKMHLLNSGLTAMETILGWTFFGSVGNSSGTDNVGRHENLASTMLTSTLSDSAVANLWKLDVIGVEEPSVKVEQKEQLEATLNHFRDTVSFNEEGRYEVKLPWVQDVSVLPTNYAIACKRLQATTKKLITSGNYKRYDDVFKEWIKEELIERVPETELTYPFTHYLPHRAVFKENRLTTKIRPVFDASARQKNSPSLNCCLNKGPNMVELIPSEILRFRRNKYGVSGDVRKAFQQISVFKKDRDYLRFLWWEDKSMNKMVTYRHRRVVFGVTCSPFQLQAVIKHHLERCRDGRCEKVVTTPQLERTIETLLKCFYVDNCLTSFDSKEEVKVFVRDSKALLDAGGFELRSWEFSENLESLPSETEEPTSKVLGLRWDRQKDSLGLNAEVIGIGAELVTKRAILSAVHKVFDPIGFTSPVVLVVKLLLREVYTKGTDWDTEVCADIKQRFNRWVEELPWLLEVDIPRWLQLELTIQCKYQIHTFVDASENAYAAVVFLRRSSEDDCTRITLIEAKSRLAPIKKLSIPRLELLAATIGARLTDSIRQELGHEIEVFYWTDSSTTLAWIKRSETWKIFVGNRVKEIRELTDINCWRLVPGEKNPADLPSRGCSPRKLFESKWWEGPLWLYNPSNEWPNSSIDFDERAITEEKKNIANLAMLVTQANCDYCLKPIVKGMICCPYNGRKWYCRYFSKYSQMVNLVGYMLRFVGNCRQRPGERALGNLTTLEREDAERRLLKFVQDDVFQGKELKKIEPLQPFIDDCGVIRIKTKIYERFDNMNFRCPYILPGDHDVTRALIREYHEKHSHAGTQILLNALREKFWIVRGRKSVRSVIGKCVVCRRYNSRPLSTIAPPLPPDRVNDAPPFQITGIDLAGPLYLKGKQKSWIVLFTCAVFRAVHLELVSSLSTDDFLQSLRRFVARRGRPSIVYSDNGTNFKGAARAFQKLNWNLIHKYATEDQIVWKFNPPTACWWGGWWERLIGLVKQLLRKSLGKACLSHDEMVTLLCDVEAIVIGRPLTYLSEDPQDLVPLTPSQFLHGNVSHSLPECDAISAKSLNKRLKYLQKNRDSLRARFRKEYLGQLIQKRSKRQEEGTSSSELRIGDVVLIENDNAKRLDWPLARVEELITGRDGKIRLVRVKAKHQSILRPIRRIYSLEVQQEDVVGALRTAVTMD